MKNNPSSHLKTCWQVLTEVPGWNDAPIYARLARSLPIVFPVFAILALVSWRSGYGAPRAEAEHAALQPLLGLDAEISTLQMGASQAQVADLNQRSASSSRLLVSGPKELPALLQELKTTLHSSGWDATFQVGEIIEESPEASPTQITFLPVRGKLKAQASNQDRFSSLLAALDRLSAYGKRIDLTRVAIRADESRWQAVEVNLRFVCSVLDAKTPQ